MVEKNIAAVHHQHFFSFRLDMDVDGAANRVVEMNSVSMPPGPQNPQNNGFMMQETPLRTERRPPNATSTWRAAAAGLCGTSAQNALAATGTRCCPEKTRCRSRSRSPGCASAPGS